VVMDGVRVHFERPAEAGEDVQAVTTNLKRGVLDITV